MIVFIHRLFSFSVYSVAESESDLMYENHHHHQRLNETSVSISAAARHGANVITAN